MSEQQLGATAHRFLRSPDHTGCHVCGRVASDAIHDQPYSIHGIKHHSGDFVYLDVGSIDLTIRKECTKEALEKVIRFLENMLARRV